ncbi:UNVERIFIED_CONTAM: hypothetical protein RMT77_005344 [Armadillidium vulgare]
MKKNKLKILSCSKFLLIFSVFLFCPLETNAKSAHSHLDSLEVVRTSLTRCSRIIDDLLSLLISQTTKSVPSTTPHSPTRRTRHHFPTRSTRHLLPTRSTRHLLPTRSTRHLLPTRSTRHFRPTIFPWNKIVAEILEKEFNNANSLIDLTIRPPKTTTTTTPAPDDWGTNVGASLSRIDDIVEIFNDDLENETNANLLWNETDVLQDLVENAQPSDVSQSDYTQLIEHATNTQNSVLTVESDVEDDYDKYDKQRKVTISLSTLGAAIILSLVIIMTVIYTKNKRRKNSSDTSSISSGSNSPSLKGNENPETPTDLYMSSQERFGIPRVTSNYVKDGRSSTSQPSTSQPSTSLEDASLSSKRENENVGQTRY